MHHLRTHTRVRATPASAPSDSQVHWRHAGYILDLESFNGYLFHNLRVEHTSNSKKEHLSGMRWKVVTPSATELRLRSSLTNLSWSMLWKAWCMDLHPIEMVAFKGRSRTIEKQFISMWWLSDYRAPIQLPSAALAMATPPQLSNVRSSCQCSCECDQWGPAKEALGFTACGFRWLVVYQWFWKGGISQEIYGAGYCN